MLSESVGQNGACDCCTYPSERSVPEHVATLMAASISARAGAILVAEADERDWLPA